MEKPKNDINPVHLTIHFHWYADDCPYRNDVIKWKLFRVTGPLCGEYTGHRWIPLTKASDVRFDVFFDMRLNKRLSKQSRRRWFGTPLRSLWRHCLWSFFPSRCFSGKDSPLRGRRWRGSSMSWPWRFRYKCTKIPFVFDGVIKWKHFSRYCPFVRGIHRSPVDSPQQRLLTRRFNVFFDLRQKKRLSKQSRRRCFETPWRSLWRHCNEFKQSR